MQIQETATIRNRGQLTIPDTIRAKFEWTQPDSVVSIKTFDDKIIIKPYSISKKKDWDVLFDKLKRIRSFKGKRGNLSKFVMQDRKNH